VVADSPVPLCSPAQLQSGALADLFRGYDGQGLTDLLIEGTRRCEDLTGRRLASFSGVTETHRAEGMDPDEYTDSANLPMDLQGTLGRSYAYALGASTLVRHCWLNEFAPRYQEMWAYRNVQITIIRSYGGSEILSSAQFTGAETDSGHVWFQLGLFIPIGSLIRVTYGGGYVVSTPASLVRANKWICAEIALRELNPAETDHNPDQLHEAALEWLAPWMRE
jgi:hypothetical protein